MTSVRPKRSQPQHSQSHTVLPPLTPDIIQRAREGWEAASDRQVRLAIQNTFDRLEGLAKGKSDGRMNGWVRRWVLRLLVRTLFRVKVEYPERLPDEPALLAANHLNHIDPLLIVSELPVKPYCYILGDARSLYNHGWKRFFLRLSQGVIPLKRLWKEEIAVMEGAAGREDLADLAAKIERDVPDGRSIEMLRQLDRVVGAIFERGDSLMLFPEGRLGTAEGQLLPLKRGAVTYALRAGVPIVPMALVGTKDLYLRKTLTLRFGEPIRLPRSKRPKSPEIKAAIAALEAAMTDLLPQDYREEAGFKPMRYCLNHMFW